ncbi:MAG: ATP-binding protein, partial [Nitrospirota bacterium]|nr:ATP-binding protein [Nitrospirota bacterium]
MNAENLLGRKNELDMLARIASRAASGDANSVFLNGKRGTGKTKLLTHLFHHMFGSQDEVVPFFHTVKSPFVTVENFARDYLGSFILQRLAFRKKDLSMTDTGLYALDDLAGLAKESGALWAVELIEGFLRI